MPTDENLTWADSCGVVVRWDEDGETVGFSNVPVRQRQVSCEYLCRWRFSVNIVSYSGFVRVLCMTCMFEHLNQHTVLSVLPVCLCMFVLVLVSVCMCPFTCPCLNTDLIQVKDGVWFRKDPKVWCCFNMLNRD